MATVTKPIALNETFKTTESTPRNLADVLAQALASISSAIGGLNFLNFEVVQELPVIGISTTTIYLVPKNPAQTDNLYDEYINIDGTSAGWEKIGDTEIDLSDYYNKTETDTLLSGKVDKVDGKGLSTNDYTTAEKTKLAGIEAGAEVNPTSSAKTATESFETVNGGLLSKCMIDLVPVQSGSGDPSPDNVRPISGHTEVDLHNVGKNFAEYDNENNPNRDAFNYSSDTAESLIATRLNAGGVFIVQFRAYVIAGKTYTFSFGKYAFGGTAQSTANIYIYSDNLWGTVVKANWNVNKTGSEWVSTYTGEVVFGIFNGSSVGTMIELEKFQVELGSTATSYEPYLGHLYQVQIGSTVYGGYVDLVSGVMTAIYGYVDLGSLNWVYDGGNFRTDDLTDKEIPTASRTQLMYCSCYLVIDDGRASSAVPNNSIYSVYSNVNSYRVVIKDSRYTDPSALATALSGQKLVYPLATPQTIQFTPQQIETLAGQNNLSTPLDGQSIETNGVEYKELFTFADVKEYVDKKIPDAPTTDGTYTLQAVVSGGVPTYSWT